MKHRTFWRNLAVGRVAGLILLIPLLSACERQVLAISAPASQEVREAENLLAGTSVPANATPTISHSDATARLTRIQNRIIPASLRVCERVWARSYCQHKIDAIRIKLDWEQQSVNAYANQNDQVGFYGGIMHLLQRDDEIAGVMAHEIGHVLLKHNRKAASNALLGGFTGILAGVLLASKTRDTCATSSCRKAQKDLVLEFAELGSEIGAIAYSPAMELEADHLGAFIANEAGYDLDTSVQAFVRMHRLRRNSETSGRGYDSYFRTHPLSDERIAHYLQTQKDIASGKKTRPELLDDN